MKITVTANRVKIVAVLKIEGLGLIRHERTGIRDALADRLQDAAAGLPYISTPRSRVKVS